MTWDEFKAAIDAEIAKHGADGSIEIWYIDMPAYPRVESINIQVRSDDRDDAADGQYELAVW